MTETQKSVGSMRRRKTEKMVIGLLYEYCTKLEDI
jgi:hypothetical protein